MSGLKEFIKRHIDLEKYDRRMDAVKGTFRTTGRKIRPLFGYRFNAHLNSIFSKKKSDFHFLKSSKSNNKYLVIRLEFPIMGLFSTLSWSIPGLKWAKAHGYTPSIDWEFPFTFRKDELGKYDFLSTLYDQKVSPSDCPKLGKTLVTTTNAGDYAYLKKYGSPFILSEWNDKKKNEEIKDLFYSSGIKPQMSIFEDIPVVNQGGFAEGRVLGVMIREEFCKSAKEIIKNEEQKKLLYAHPTLPDIPEIIGIIKEHLVKWECSSLFLSCASTDTIEELSKEFGDKLMYVKRDRFSVKEWYGGKGSAAFGDYEREDMDELFPVDEMMNREKTYLQEIYTLSRCDCLIASPSGGLMGCMMLKEGEFREAMMLPYV